MEPEEELTRSDYLDICKELENNGDIGKLNEINDNIFISIIDTIF